MWPFRRRRPVEVLVDEEHAVLVADRPLDEHQAAALADAWRCCHSEPAAVQIYPRCRLCGRSDETVHVYMRLWTFVPGELTPAAVIVELCELCTRDDNEAQRIARLLGMAGA